MQDYKRGSNTVLDYKCHIVMITKYRYPVLSGDLGLRCREFLRDMSRKQKMTIYAGAFNRDRVHLLIDIQPSLSVSCACSVSKGKSSHRLLGEFSILKKRYWGQHLYACGYWVASSGNVIDNVWKEYTENQKPE